jgi:hypothetical protein
MPLLSYPCVCPFQAAPFSNERSERIFFTRTGERLNPVAYRNQVNISWRKEEYQFTGRHFTAILTPLCVPSNRARDPSPLCSLLRFQAWGSNIRHQSDKARTSKWYFTALQDSDTVISSGRRKAWFHFQGLDPGPKTRELEYQITVLYKSHWHSWSSLTSECTCLHPATTTNTLKAIRF